MLLPLPSLAQLLLNQDITMDMVMVMDMVDMDTTDTMEREKLRLAIIMDMDMVMDMVDMVIMDTMEREKLSLATTIMAMDMDMVDMVIMATMERGKPKQLLLLSQDTITMDTVIMEDMDTMDIMERERLKPPLLLSQDIIIMAMDMVMVMAMVMDTMVKQQLFIDSSIFSIIDLDFLKSSQQKHTIVKNKQNSLFEKIKKDETEKQTFIFLFL